MQVPARFSAFLIAILLLAGLNQPAQAGWPQKSVKIIVPFGPGGNSDGIARILGARLGEALGQQFVVENRAGAGGALGAEAVARSPNDGYTLLLTSVTQLAVVPVMTKAPYDPVKDFAPISNIATNPLVLVASPSLPVKTVAEFVDYVRARPGQLSYAVGTPGSVGHLSMALFLNRAGLEMIPLSYKASGPVAIGDIIGGHVPAYFPPLSDVLPHRASGALRLLAVSSDKRLARLPDVPTLDESGFPGFKTQSWNGLLAPAGTPKEIIDRIAQEIARAMKDPKFTGDLANFGVDPLGNSPQEFAAMIGADIAFWGEVIKRTGLHEK